MSDEDGVEVLGLEGEELKLTESPFRTIHHCSNRKNGMSFDLEDRYDREDSQHALPSLETAKELQFLVRDGPPPLEVPKKVSSTSFLCDTRETKARASVNLSGGHFTRKKDVLTMS